MMQERFNIAEDEVMAFLEEGKVGSDEKKEVKGHVLSLIEKAQEEFDQKEALLLEKKLKKRKFDLEDFRKQLAQIKKLGSLEQIMGMMPGMGQIKQLKKLKPDEKELVKIEAIIDSMTRKERANHKIINGSRRKRIARGSGTKVQDVNRLLKNFMQMKKMMEKLTSKGLGGMPGLLGRL
jgi:signal recognition particle subunit SRP54